MTEHLPECERWFTGMPDPDECPACEMFRACEQRVLGLNPVAAGVLIAQRSRERALAAAREAVDALGHEVDCINPHEDGLPCIHDQVKSAIDALREKP